jgi:hypothetical protein
MVVRRARAAAERASHRRADWLVSPNWSSIGHHPSVKRFPDLASAVAALREMAGLSSFEPV